MAIDNKMAHHGIIQSLSPSCDSLPHRSARPAAAFCGIDLGPKKHRVAPLLPTGTATNGKP